MTNTVIVTMADVRAAHLCSGGTRKFFERYGLDYTSFLRNGIPAEYLMKTGDALAAGAIAVAEKRTKQSGE